MINKFRLSSYIFIFTFILLIFCNYIDGYSKNSLFAYITKKVSLEKDQYVLSVFLDVRDCVGCDINMVMASNCINEQISKLRLPVKIIAIVDCRRDKEIKLFKSKFNWQYFAIRNKGEAKKYLDLKKNAFLSIHNAKGQKILEIPYGSKNLCNRIMSIFQI